MVPTNRGRMCTPTNENVIPFKCITNKAVNTNNVFILIFISLGHGFLRDRWSIRRQTHVESTGQHHKCMCPCQKQLLSFFSLVIMVSVN